MCRSSERALMVRVAFHPDSRSRAVWCTAFGEDGQGELFSDVRSFADDADGRAELLEQLADDLNHWIQSGFGVSVGGADYL